VSYTPVFNFGVSSSMFQNVTNGVGLEFFGRILLNYLSNENGRDARIILKWIFKKCNEGVDRIHLVENRNKWRVF
jgi:hypothetical protein